MAYKRKGSAEFPHMRTTILIKTCSTCSECPFKVYSEEKDNVILGTGNIHGNNIFVLPTYDYKAKEGYTTLLSLLVDFYDKEIGQNLFEDVYVTRLVKCNHRSEHELYNDAIGPCLKFLQYEINKLGARNVVFFGQTYDEYIANSDTVGRYIPFKNIHKAYSPAVLFYDNPKIIAEFTKQINEAINS